MNYNSIYIMNRKDKCLLTDVTYVCLEYTHDTETIDMELSTHDYLFKYLMSNKCYM